MTYRYKQYLFTKWACNLIWNGMKIFFIFYKSASRRDGKYSCSPIAFSFCRVYQMRPVERSTTFANNRVGNGNPMRMHTCRMYIPRYLLSAREHSVHPEIIDGVRHSFA